MDGIVAFVDVVLAGLFTLTVIQNAPNLAPDASLDVRVVTLGIALVGVCCLLGAIGTLARTRSVAGLAHALIALGLLALGGFIGFSLVSGWSAYRGVPWEGLMICAALLGFTGFFTWLAVRTLKAP